MAGLKDQLLRLLLLPGSTLPFAPLLRDCATIFFFHRFEVPDLGVRGHASEPVRIFLARLRRLRFEIVSLEDVFRRLRGDGPRLRRTVAFTIDDGYFDQASVAAPLFAEFDCPVTTFVATGFLDRELWMWWDRLEHVLAHAKRPSLAVRLGGEPLRYDWSDDAARRRALLDLTERLKRVPDAEKHAAIDALAVAAEVEIPRDPPPAYAPMTWDELRAAEKLGMQFGAHTVTHPILSQTPDAQSRHELTRSWERLQQEAARPSPVFCYPNGTPADYGPREMRTLDELGMLGAVLGVPGYADRASFASRSEGRFEVRRFGYDARLAYNLQVVSGLERFKQIVRGNAAA